MPEEQSTIPGVVPPRVATNWPKKPDLSAFFGGDDED